MLVGYHLCVTNYLKKKIINLTIYLLSMKSIFDTDFINYYIYIFTFKPLLFIYMIHYMAHIKQERSKDC